jgi:hypothetical protein
MAVDFPAPFGPSRARVSPLATSRSRRSSATTEPYRCTTLSNRNARCRTSEIGQEASWESFVMLAVTCSLAPSAEALSGRVDSGVYGNVCEFLPRPYAKGR